jgi:N-acetylglucosamine-6-phosphate deacetylase
MSNYTSIRGDIVLPDTILENGYVTWLRDEIVTVSSRPPTQGDVLDRTGCLVAPGFVDIHVHGGAGADYMDGTTDAVRTVNRAHAAHGTTSIFPTTTTGSFADLDAMVSACETVQANWAPADGARIAGVHFYGPYFAPDKVGCHAPEGRRDPVREEYEYFLNRPIIRIATCAAELPGALDFYAFARARDCLVTCGHSNAWWGELEAAFAQGMRHVDHFWSAMSSVSSLRARFGTPMRAGMEQFVLANEDMSTELIADGEHLSDDLLRFGFEMIGCHRTCLVTDANRALDMPPGRYRFGPILEGTMVTSDGRTVRGEDGGLASSMRGMNEMVKVMARAIVKDRGRDLPRVIRMASLTPAELTGTDRTLGSLEVGKRADIVVLDCDFEVVDTILSGTAFRG